MPPDTAAASPLFVACLCAEWCGSCREYRDAFAAQSRTAAPGDVYAWIDIEDHADVLGDLEIETFPTLLIGDAADRVLFCGSVTPHAGTLARLVAVARQGELKPLTDGDIVELARRARAHVAAQAG